MDCGQYAQSFYDSHVKRISTGIFAKPEENRPARETSASALQNIQNMCEAPALSRL
jgi:hypothetical protein